MLTQPLTMTTTHKFPSLVARAVVEGALEPLLAVGRVARRTVPDKRPEQMSSLKRNVYTMNFSTSMYVIFTLLCHLKVNRTLKTKLSYIVRTSLFIIFFIQSTYYMKNASMSFLMVPEVFDKLV